MSRGKVRVLLVDDHRMVRDGLRAILSREERIEVVGEAGDGREAIEAVRRDPPDVVVMDVGLPGMNGIEATRQIREEHPDVAVIALSTYSDRRYVENMLRAGARGYVLKKAAADELVRAVEAVRNGHCYTSPEVTSHVVESSLRPEVGGRSSAYTLLGRREREVLQLLAEGRTSPQIAALLSISARTVEAHRRNIMRKLDLRTIAELTKYAVREGLTSLDR